MPRTVPLWLWAEHAALLAITGLTVYDIWKSRRENKRPFHSLSQALDSLVVFFTGQPNVAAPGAKELVASPAAGATGGTTTLADSLTAQRGVTQAQALASLPGEVLARLQAIKQLAGPKAVLSWPDVSEAPGASMDMSSVAEGEATAYRDGRGAIYKFKLGEGVFVNMYFTKAGYRRSGDLHDCNQYDVVLQGRTRLRMLDPHTGSEVVQEYGANDFIVIPARTPHMFEFLEDNYLLEWWDDTFKAWYYKPYRSMIEAGLPLADTEGRDLSLLARPAA